MAITLQSFFKKWRWYTPKLFNNHEEPTPWRLQFRYISHGEVQRIENMSEEEVNAEKDRYPSVKTFYEDNWDLIENTDTKKRLLMILPHVGRIEGLETEVEGEDGQGNPKTEVITDFFQLLELLTFQQTLELLTEVLGAVSYVEKEDSDADQKN